MCAIVKISLRAIIFSQVRADVPQARGKTFSRIERTLNERRETRLLRFQNVLKKTSSNISAGKKVPNEVSFAGTSGKLHFRIRIFNCAIGKNNKK